LGKPQSHLNEIKHLHGRSPFYCSSRARDDAAKYSKRESVMPGLNPGIHVFLGKSEVVDGRDKPGRDASAPALQGTLRLQPR
jgi:hypothetical protein